MKKVLIALLVFLGSCKSTESINRFAKPAASGTAEIIRSLPAFAEICRQFDPVALRVYTDTSLYANLRHPAIHCSEYKVADSLSHIISETLVNYFSLLASVSDKKLISYNARDLVNSLDAIQPQVFPSLALTDEKVSAVKGLLNALLNEPLKGYRHRKLIQTLKQNDSALGRVITAYIFILDSALSGEIEQAKSNYTSFVYAPLFEWTQTPVEKQWVNRQYREFIASLNTDQEKIHKSVLLLKLIRKDHQMLAFGKPPSGLAYTADEISQDILLLNKLVTEIIQLVK